MADERDRLRRLRQLEAATAPAPRPAAFTPDAQDIRDPRTNRTPAQLAAQQALAEAVAAGRDLGIVTRTNVAKPGNVPTVTVVRTPTTTGGGGGGGSGGGGTKTVVSTYIDPTTGDVIAVYSDGTTAVLSKGTKEADAARAKAEADAAAKAGRQ